MSDYYIIIPPEVRSHPDLRPIDKLVMGEIISLSRSSGSCWASNAYLAKIHGVSERTITIGIKTLADLGLISVTYVSKNLSTQRTITPAQKFMEGSQNLRGGVAESARGGSQNLRTNNTRVNNTSITIQESEVVEFFTSRQKSQTEAMKFFHYYDALGWMVGKNPIRNWRSLANKWISNIKPEPKVKILK